MPNKFIHHLTINTGHSRRSYLREVADWAIESLHHPLAIALTGSPGDIPGQPGYTIMAAAKEIYGF